MIFVLRISLPDVPGSLGRVASAFGKGGVNILTLDVIDSEDGVAVDDLRVEAPDGMQEALRRAGEEVPGFAVEYVRPLEAFRHVLEPLELAARLADAGAEAVAHLVEDLPDALGASWAIAFDRTEDPPRTLAASIGAPTLARLPAAWVNPDRGPWRSDTGLEVASAPLGASAGLLLGRERGPRFRLSELRHIRLLAQIAAGAALLLPAAMRGTPGS
ncbi:MAG TPA: ACT domain-containing protein [Actinomycetota bacterium]|nr:ACT domain-containing protein [Actinomycetota bacterium]